GTLPMPWGSTYLSERDGQEGAIAHLYSRRRGSASLSELDGMSSAGSSD
ncbi:hypothetical protein NPIL_234741, partial [Nephila pilipes]